MPTNLFGRFRLEAAQGLVKLIERERHVRRNARRARERRRRRRAGRLDARTGEYCRPRILPPAKRTWKHMCLDKILLDRLRCS